MRGLTRGSVDEAAAAAAIARVRVCKEVVALALESAQWLTSQRAWDRDEWDPAMCGGGEPVDVEDGGELFTRRFTAPWEHDWEHDVLTCFSSSCETSHRQNGM